MKYYQVILICLLVSACVDSDYRPVALDSNFGRSIKQVTQAQILNPKAAANPPQTVSKRLDGQVGQNVMNTYRKGFSQVEKVETININIGGNSSSSSK